MHFAPAPVTVFGAGLVGLVSAAGLAELEHAVVCTDVDSARVAALQRGTLALREPGLAELIARHVDTGRLRFTTDTDDAVAHGRLHFVCVGTPEREDGSSDVEPVLAVARDIGERLLREGLVVVKSTVPPGTTERVRTLVAAMLVQRELPDLRFNAVANPEFLTPGQAVEGWMNPDRIVVGADDARALATMHVLYGPLLKRREQWMPMRLRSAELAKGACNAMLAARISLMNELAQFAERCDADIVEVRRALASDPRIGSRYLAPGCGYGGPHLPRDVRALLAGGAELGLAMPLLDAVEQVNERQKRAFAERVLQALTQGSAGAAAGRRVAFWGLSYKPGADDLREAPCEPLLRALAAAGVQVVAHDAGAQAAARARYGELPGFALVADPLAAVDGADALVIATDCPPYWHADWADVRRRMRGRRVFDARNVCDPARMAEQGFAYHGIGRASPVASRAASGARAAPGMPMAM